FKEVVVRAEMFAHHHVQRERLSVRERMTHVLSTLERTSIVEFVHLFRPEEGRMGVTITFIAILELMREGLIDIVQAEPFAPIHVRAAAGNRMLRVVGEDSGASEAAAQAEAASAEALLADEAFDEGDEDEGSVESEESVEDVESAPGEDSAEPSSEESA